MSSSPSTRPQVDDRLPVHEHTPKNPSPLRQVMSMDGLPATPRLQPAPPPKMKLDMRTKEADSKDDSDGSIFGGPPTAEARANEDAARDDDEAALSISSLPRVLSRGADVSDVPVQHDDSPAKASSAAYHFNNTPLRGAEKNDVENEGSLTSSPTSPTHAPRTIRVTIRERSRQASAEPPRIPTLAPVRPVQNCTPAIPTDHLPCVSEEEDQESQQESQQERGRNDVGHAQQPEQGDGADAVDYEQAEMERRRERKRERASRRAKEREARKRLERYERAHLERERTRQSVCRWLGVPVDEASRDGEAGDKQRQDGQVDAQGAAGARPGLTSFPPPTFPPPKHPLPALPATSQQVSSNEESQSKETEPGAGDGKASSKQEQGGC